MTKRKPLSRACDGNFDCPVPEHVISTTSSRGRTNVRHITLTLGQQRTLDERRDEHVDGAFRIQFDFLSILGFKKSHQRFPTAEAAQAWLDEERDALEPVPEYWARAKVVPV